MILKSQHVRKCAVITVLLAIGCCQWLAAADSPESLIPDPEGIIKKILGLDEMTKNVCLIDSHQMVNAADLPGRLVAISPDLKVPSDLLRYSFRKDGAKTTTQVNPPSSPIRVTRIETSQAVSGSLTNWFGASMTKGDIAELRAIPLPASSISVDELDEKSISDRFSTVPESTRKGLGIVTDVIPYEVWASVCKKTSKSVSGVWCIKLGKEIYAKQEDELRRYYLVAVYTPILFYDDIGVIPTEKSTTISSLPWGTDKQILNRSEMLAMWLQAKSGEHIFGTFAFERAIPGVDSPQFTPPKFAVLDEGLQDYAKPADPADTHDYTADVKEAPHLDE